MLLIIEESNTKCVVTVVYHWMAQVCCRKVRDNLPVETVSAEPETERGETVCSLPFLTKMCFPSLVNC